MSRTPRIVVTGIGCLSPIGHGVSNFWQALLDGKNGIGKITSFDPSDLTTQIAAEIHDFNPDDYMNKKKPSAWTGCFNLPWPPPSWPWTIRA